MKANVVLWHREGGRKESSVSRLTASLPYLVLKYVVELMSLPCLPSGSWFIAITSLREEVREEVREEAVREVTEGSRGEGGEEVREGGGREWKCGRR